MNDPVPDTEKFVDMADAFIMQVVEKRIVRDDSCILFLRVSGEKGLSYRAGQYVNLAFDDCEARPYSIANAPQDGLLEFHIKDSSHGGGSTYAFKTLQKGDVVKGYGPFGSCVLEPNNKKPLLLIAGGLGIAPMKAILEEALREGTGEKIVLYWGTNSVEEQYIYDDFRAQEKEHDSFEFVSATNITVGEAVVRGFDNLDPYSIYLAGPVEMVKTILPLLIERGARRSCLYTDDSALMALAAEGQVFDAS